MKIIYYKDDKSQWWVDRVGHFEKCRECSFLIEKGDIPERVCLGASYLHAEFKCPACGGQVSVMNR